LNQFSESQGAHLSPLDDAEPLSSLVSRQEALLEGTRIVERASESALYRRAWGLKRGEVRRARSLDELQEIPMISSADYKEAFERFSISDIVLGDNTVTWHSSSGSSGEPKWFPYTMRDIARTREQILRLYRVLGVREDDIVLQFSSVAPMISDAVPYWMIDAMRDAGLRIQCVIVSFYLLQFAMPFAIKIQPTMLTGLPSMLMLIAEHLPESSRERTMERLREEPSVKHLLYAALTRVKRVRPRDVLRRLRVGVFGGDLLDPYRPYVEEEYGMEAFDVYSLTESSVYASECEAHDGLHLWIDTQVAEVIPKDELEREREEPGYVPKATYLHRAPQDTEGELVLTNFREALPLIRYRTGDLIRVRGTSKCSCSRTHPRIKILGRLDDLINLGGLRFSEAQLDRAMRRVKKHGKVRAWRAVLSREGYKPRITIQLQAQTSNESALIEELNDRILMDIPALGTALRVELILPLEVEFTSDLGEDLTTGGKFRRVVYDESFARGRPE